jgi:broad specificity phosphatase PhoE
LRQPALLAVHLDVLVVAHAAAARALVGTLRAAHERTMSLRFQLIARARSLTEPGLTFG